MNVQTHWSALLETNQANLDLLFHALMIIWLVVLDIIWLVCHFSLKTWAVQLGLILDRGKGEKKEKPD